jgi:uncharacterized membrane protein YkgB
MDAAEQAPKPSGPKGGIDPIIFGEIELLLAEKRTAFSALRTGIAVFALPITVLSFLVATSRFYEVLRVLQFLVPLLAINAAMVALGCYLIVQSIHRVRHYDALIRKLKREHSVLAHVIE